MNLRVMESAAMSGVFRMRVCRRGVLAEEWEERNLIVDGARALMARLVAGDSGGTRINRIAFGKSGNIPVPDDAEITEPFIKLLDSHSFPAARQVMFNWPLAAIEANGKEIREFGLFCADGALFARRIRDRPIYKESDIALEGEWIITF